MWAIKGISANLRWALKELNEKKQTNIMNLFRI